jgi:hypothetical protein
LLLQPAGRCSCAKLRTVTRDILHRRACLQVFCRREKAS